jgi:hypothetical protein
LARAFRVVGAPAGVLETGLVYFHTAQYVPEARLSLGGRPLARQRIDAPDELR